MQHSKLLHSRTLFRTKVLEVFRHKKEIEQMYVTIARL